MHPAFSEPQESKCSVFTGYQHRAAKPFEHALNLSHGFVQPTFPAQGNK